MVLAAWNTASAFHTATIPPDLWVPSMDPDGLERAHYGIDLDTNTTSQRSLQLVLQKKSPTTPKSVMPGNNFTDSTEDVGNVPHREFPLLTLSGSIGDVSIR